MNERLRQSGITEFTVNVVASNKDALRFYERHNLIPKTIMLQGAITDMLDTE